MIATCAVSTGTTVGAVTDNLGKRKGFWPTETGSTAA
jgi:hypothetical protein